MERKLQKPYPTDYNLNINLNIKLKLKLNINMNMIIKHVKRVGLDTKIVKAVLSKKKTLGIT